MSWVVMSVSSRPVSADLPIADLPIADLPIADCRLTDVRSGCRRCGEPEDLAELVDHQVPALHLGNGLAPDNLVLPGELTCPAAGPDGHCDGYTHGVVLGKVGSSLG